MGEVVVMEKLSLLLGKKEIIHGFFRRAKGLKTKVMVHFVSHKHCPFLEYNKRSVTWSQMPNYPFVTFRLQSCC